jgi:cytochrome oxidase Cu insertion factor (SCO1/SenC/PrrC family)
MMDRAVTAAGLDRRVHFVELTVDAGRDTPSRLRAYRKLIGAPANWSLLTGKALTANTATTAVTVRTTPPSQARRRVRRSASQPILSIPISPSGLNKVRVVPRQGAARSALESKWAA